MSTTIQPAPPPFILNELGQPIGLPLPAWQPPPCPARATLPGRYSRLEPLEAARHGPGLYSAFAADQLGRLWTYLPYGPFAHADQFATWLQKSCLGADPLFFAIIPNGASAPAGLISLMRIMPEQGSIEIGHVIFSPSLQRTTVATEATFLLLQHAFHLGYRRCEWKCDSLNAPSRAAAARLGFQYEGTFRQATVYKSRTRDTAWYAIVDRDWPRLAAAFQTWLAPENFDTHGMQKLSLLSLTKRAGAPAAG